MNNTALLDRKEQYLNYINNTFTVPAIPFVIQEVTKVIEDPMASAANLAEIINKDQGLVTKILSVANSPLYGIPRRVSTIDFAIIILGFNHIKNIIVAFSLMDTLQSFNGNGFNRKEYWHHSLLTALAAKRIADDLGANLSGEAFTAGLLHDLGLPILGKYFPKEFKKIYELAKNENLPYLEAENRVMGLTHMDIGRVLIERWNLPISLSTVIGNHHRPSLAEGHKQMAAVVHLADYMTRVFDIGKFEWDEGFEFDHEVINILKLGNEEYLNGFMQSYESLLRYQMESLKSLE